MLKFFKTRPLSKFLAISSGNMLAVLACLAQAVEDAPTGAMSPAAKNRQDIVDDTVFPLPEIVVLARRIEAPATIIRRQVTFEDISVWNSHNVGDALTLVPGVNVQTGGSSGDARAWVRGFRDRDVLILFDGIPVASGFEGTIDLNEIAVDNVSVINVYKSAPSVIYGTNGVGGVIDVVPQRRRQGSFFNATLETGEDGRHLANATLGGGDGNFNYSISVQHQESGDFSLSDNYTRELNQTSSQRVNSDFERDNVLLQVEALETPIGHSSFFVSLSDAEKGLPVETGVDDPDFERLSKSRRQTYGVSNHFKNIPLSLKLYYNGYDSELKVYTDESFSELDEVEEAEDYSYGAKLYSTINTSENNTVILSASGQTDVYKAEEELEEGSKAELATYTIAIENQFWITRKFSIAAGAIYNYFDQTRLGKTSDAFNPQLALAWQATPAMSLHASAAQRTRFPKLRELYRRKYGNPDLDPQEANNYEIGMKYVHPSGLTGDVAVFRSDIDDLIERPHRRSLYMNLDRVTINGIELAGGGWITDDVFARIAYTYIDAEEDLPDGGNRQLRSRPENTAVVDFRYRLPRQFEFSFNGIYVSGLHDLDPDGVYTEISSYFVANVKVSRKFGDHYEAYVSSTNVADEDYFQRIGNPREGRAFMVGLKLDF